MKYYGDIPKELEYPNRTLFQGIEFATELFPNNIAYDFEGNKVDYTKFLGQVCHASACLHELGVRKGDKVLICLPIIPQTIIMFYGINRLGAIATMIHPLSSRKEIDFYLENSGSKIAITLDMFYPNFPKIGAIPSLEKIIVTSAKDELNTGKAIMYQIIQGRKDPKPVFSKDILCWKSFLSSTNNREIPLISRNVMDPACILYSGGTTGKSKGVLLSNSNLNSTAIQTAMMSECANDGNTMLAIMPAFHVFGLCICIHMVLMHGFKCILVPRLTADVYSKAIVKKKPNFIAGVPTLFELMIRNKHMSNADLSFLKGIFCGGDSLTVDLKIKFDKFLSDHNCTTTIREGCGLTECVTASCLMPKNIKLQKEGSIGIPLPDTFYKIVKVGTTEKVDYDTGGEICISGPSVMMSYLNEPEETSNTLRLHDDGRTWLHTGDMGAMDFEGYIYFKQRIKRIIISSGYNIYPSQIEEVICNHPYVQSCYVIGVPDETRSQVVKAFIVLKEDMEHCERLEESIMEHCKEGISKYALPKYIEFINALPVTKVGKVAYTELEGLEWDKIIPTSQV